MGGIENMMQQMGGMGGMSGMGGMFGGMGGSDGSTGSTGTGTSTSTAPQNPFSAFGGMGGGMGGNPFSSFQQPNTGEQNFDIQLQQLEDMGFTNRQVNLRALQATYGNVEAAIERILSGI